jgi:hypothetical protein
MKKPSMKKLPVNALSLLAAAMLAVGAASPAHSRDDLLKLPIKDALAKPDAQQKVDPKVKLFFGDQPFPKPLQNLAVVTANKKTNFANKSDKDGCDYVFLSAVLALQQRAAREGGNAVVNITSVYRKNVFKSQTEYQCGAGALIGGVALEGQIVKLP